MKLVPRKNSSVLRLNQIMSKLLTISKCWQLNCQQIQQLFATVTLFWICRTFSHFRISHFSYHLKYNWPLLKAVNNILTSYIKSCYVYVKFKRASQSCSPSKINQSINVEWRTCARNGKQFFSWKQEKLWSFEKAWNVLIEINLDMGNEKYVSTRLR